LDDLLRGDPDDRLPIEGWVLVGSGGHSYTSSVLVARVLVPPIGAEFAVQGEPSALYFVEFVEVLVDDRLASRPHPFDPRGLVAVGSPLGEHAAAFVGAAGLGLLEDCLSLSHVGCPSLDGSGELNQTSLGGVDLGLMIPR